MRLNSGYSISVLASAALLGAGLANPAAAEMVMVANYQPMPRKAPIRRVNNDTFCSQEVKSCPGGTYVGRDPANQCKFKPCPTTTALN